MEFALLLRLIGLLIDYIDDEYLLKKFIEIENYLRIKLINKNESNK